MKEQNDFDFHTDRKKAYSPKTKSLFLKIEFLDVLKLSLLYLENCLGLGLGLGLGLRLLLWLKFNRVRFRNQVSKHLLAIKIENLKR